MDHQFCQPFAFQQLFSPFESFKHLCKQRLVGKYSPKFWYSSEKCSQSRDWYIGFIYLTQDCMPTSIWLSYDFDTTWTWLFYDACLAFHDTCSALFDLNQTLVVYKMPSPWPSIDWNLTEFAQIWPTLNLFLTIVNLEWSIPWEIISWLQVMFDLTEIECQEDSKTDGSCTRLSHDFVSQNLVLDLDNCQKIVNFDQDTTVAHQSLEFPFLLRGTGQITQFCVANIHYIALVMECRLWALKDLIQNKSWTSSTYNTHTIRPWLVIQRYMSDMH